MSNLSLLLLFYQNEEDSNEIKEQVIIIWLGMKVEKIANLFMHGNQFFSFFEKLSSVHIFNSKNASNIIINILETI